MRQKPGARLTIDPKSGWPAATHDHAGIAALGVKAKGEVRSFDEAKAYLGGKDERTLASNVTVVRRSRTAIAIRLYQTDIITYHKDGTFEADNGGWNTPTTANRCSQFGPRGWRFYHHKKKLHGNGRLMAKGLRYNADPTAARDTSWNVVDLQQPAPNAGE